MNTSDVAASNPDPGKEQADFVALLESLVSPQLKAVIDTVCRVDTETTDEVVIIVSEDGSSCA